MDNQQNTNPNQAPADFSKFFSEKKKEEKAKPQSNLSTQFQKEQEWEYFITPDMGAVTRLIIKFSGGAIKTQNQANYVMIGIIIISLAISGALYFSQRSGGAPIMPPAGGLEGIPPVMGLP